MCGVIAWSRRGVAGILVALALSGCGDDPPGPVLPPLPPSASPSTSSSSASPSVRPTGTAEQQILAQYRRFWREMYTGVEAVRSGDRDAFLRPVVAEPLLSELLRVAREDEHKGVRLHGKPRILDPTLTRQGGEAVVSDCVDFTDVVLVGKSPPSEAAPQRKVIDTHLRRAADGVWRVNSLNDVKDYQC